MKRFQTGSYIKTISLGITNGNLIMDTNTKARGVSFSDQDQIEMLHNTTCRTTNNFCYKSVATDINNFRFTVSDARYTTQESRGISEHKIIVKQDKLQVTYFSGLDLTNLIELLSSNFLQLSQNGHVKIKEIINLLKKATEMMLKNELLNIEETVEDITSKEFLFSYIEPTASSSSCKHSIYAERLKDSAIKDIKHAGRKIIKKEKPSVNDIHNLFKKINSHIERLGIDQGKNKFIKYVIAIMFENTMQEIKSKSTLLNIIAVHMNNINNYFTATGKLEIVKTILDELVYWIVMYHIHYNSNLDYIMARRDSLSNIIDFLCSSLDSLLNRSAFISSFIIANNKKIKKISSSLTKIDSMSFNGTVCSYGKIWGGVTLLQKHSVSGNVYHVVDDTLPNFNKFIRENIILEESENADDFYLVKTEDYNLCQKKIYRAIEHTDILFKREIYTADKKYFSGVSFGLEGSVNSHIVKINEHRDFCHITEKLIVSSAMAMINLDDVVNPAIDAHGREDKTAPEAYIVSVCLVDDNNKELGLMDRYNQSLMHFNNKEIISETAVYNTRSKLMPYGVGMDLFVKIVSFNFIEDNTNSETENYTKVKSNNTLALASILGEYQNGNFSSIKTLKTLTTNSNLDLLQITTDNSLLATYCNNIIKKYKGADKNQLSSLNMTNFKLDDSQIQHLRKIEYLIDSLLIMNAQDSYDAYNFSAVILLVSSLIGGAQLFCCENGLTKINILDNHIKFLATEVFVNNNIDINFTKSFKENITYKQIQEATQNQYEQYLLY